jgi:hypothetical protein
VPGVCIDRTMFSLISGLDNYGEALEGRNRLVLACFRSVNSESSTRTCVTLGVVACQTVVFITRNSIAPDTIKLMLSCGRLSCSSQGSVTRSTFQLDRRAFPHDICVSIRSCVLPRSTAC